MGGFVDAATRRRRSGSRTSASPGSSAITERTSAASATVVARGPFSAMPYQSLGPSWAGTRPLPGLSPTRPQLAAGMRIEPIPSAACATGTTPEATAAAEPPDDPPAVRSASHGLRVMPEAQSVAPKTHSSGTRVMPTTTAPAARSRATTGWSASWGWAEVAVDPLRIGSPSTGTLSLTAMGTPASGSSPRSERRATASASASARSARTTSKAPMALSCLAIRCSAASVTSRADRAPLRTPAAMSVAVRPGGGFVMGASVGPGRACGAQAVGEITSVRSSWLPSARGASYQSR